MPVISSNIMTLAGRIGAALVASQALVGDKPLPKENEKRRRKCQPYYDQIESTIYMVAKRYIEYQADFLSLDETGRRTHRKSFSDRQRKLMKDIRSAEAKRCFAYRQDAKYWAKRDIDS